MTSANRAAGACAQPELFGEPLTGSHDFLGRYLGRKGKRPAQQRAGASDLQSQMAVRPDPGARLAFVRFQPLGFDTLLPPREASLAREEKGIDEVVQRGAQLFDRDQKFIGCQAPDAGLDGGDGLPVLETEDPGKIVLRELLRLSQRLDSPSYARLRHLTSDARISCIWFFARYIGER